MPPKLLQRDEIIKNLFPSLKLAETITYKDKGIIYRLNTYIIHIRPETLFAKSVRSRIW